MAGVPRLAAVIVAAAALLLGAESANGAMVTRLDRAGRPMTFDVRARGVNVNWYVARLRGSIHGDEVSDVVVRIVPPRLVKRLCGGGGSCYSSRRGEDLLTVPAGRSTQVAHYLLHEYAHHLELKRGRWRDSEPWMEQWWAARGIDALLARGKVSYEYDLGWEHSISEIFAEDYVQLHMRSRYGIGWLRPPGQGVKAALRSDLRDR
jgi:hypothetical protein